MAYYAGVDLGATNIRAVVADDEGSILGTDQRSTPRASSGIVVTEAVLDAVHTACRDAGIDPERVRAVGIGSIGPFDLAQGAVVNPANLPDEIDRIPLTGPLAELVGSDRLYLHNDTVAGVIGQRFYSDRNPDDMVYLTISSGIGAGVCIDGNVLRGWDGNAGEVGHLVVDPDGRMTCGCGKDGHWEAYCSGANIPAYAERIHEETSVTTELPVGDPEFEAADVFDRVNHDQLADCVVDRLVDWNAIGVVNVVHAYAPLVIYVGGAVALNNPELVVDPVRDRIGELVMTNVPDIELTSLGDEAVVRGAVASALTEGTGDRARLPP